ncbi:hypothetical protein LCGC14_1098240 [marine sediment metagenome]|uniref:Uncharacterized protein n=1 Tax=marine sediment metagenome TaxID=412755 RepID=A0A0F9MAE7_9ZZZZ
MKISQKVRDNFAFYERVYQRLDVRVFPTTIIAGADGCSALEAFATKEATGRHCRTREPGLLRQVLRAKAGINLRIKIWAEGIAVWTLFMWELREDKKFEWFPEWVWVAVQRQAEKIRYGS